MAEKERPGVMLYFDMRPSLRRLSAEEKGHLFECILDYAQYGELPEVDGMIGIAWDFIRPRIDRDAERYEEVSERRRQAAQKRWDKQEKEMQTDANDCKSMQMDANAYFALQTMPTTTSTPTTKTTSTPSPTATAASTAASKPRKARRTDLDLQAAAEEMSFEDLRREKLKMLSGMMGAGP